ncbi:MAG: OmpA family protein [Acidobacteriota bacterium]|nr:OmpA family protein [Acidobacteriota bacterium]
MRSYVYFVFLVFLFGTRAAGTGNVFGAEPPASAPQAQAASDQPNLTEVKSDFVPGEKTLFFDDFSDMGGDEPPPHWRVRDGAVALLTGENVRQLTSKSERVRLTPMLKNLPKDFTIETEMKFENPEDVRSIWYLHGADWDGPLGPDAELAVIFQARSDKLQVQVRHKVDGNLKDIANASIGVDYGKPLAQAIWIQKGRLRIYLNGQRVVDVNQVELPALAGAELNADYAENKVGYRTVRFAESTPDFSQVITASGRYVTHGILFDVDSDRLKPESAPVIKAIARGLVSNTALKIRIEGHTDSTGDAAHNLDLSKRRAEAVKTVLVAQFGIAEDRLTTVGLGAEKPIDSNDTPTGRAQNRRVEFVKM